MDDERQRRGAPRGFAMGEPRSRGQAAAPASPLDRLRRSPAGRRVLSTIVALLFLAGAGMFTYPFFTDLYTEQVIQDRLSEDFQRQLDADVKNVDDWQKNLRTGQALTKIVLPSLGVQTLVVEGTSPEALRAGAGHYPDTPLPGQKGNVAIAGHRTTYGRPFNALDQLTQGDRVWLLTPIGDFEYVVTPRPPEWDANPYITHPQDWTVVKPTRQPSVTLTTCHPKGSAAQRLVARAQLAAAHPPGTYESRAG